MLYLPKLTQQPITRLRAVDAERMVHVQEHWRRERRSRRFAGFVRAVKASLLVIGAILAVAGVMAVSYGVGYIRAMQQLDCQLKER